MEKLQNFGWELNPKKINCDFMTMSFDTTKLGKKHLKAAIHPYDHTVRPQIVTKKTCSHYHSLISEFKKLPNSFCNSQRES